MCSSLTMESTQPLYICISEENKEFLNSGEWDYGIVVTDLNPYVTKSELQSFFQTFGTITECNIKTDKSSGWPKGVGFVRYSSSKEAEAAQADGPHNLGGFPIWINRVVTPKLNQACQLNTPQDQSFQPNVCVN